MDVCHLKNCELEAKHQKYKVQVVLRGDIVKDDSGLPQYWTRLPRHKWPKSWSSMEDPVVLLERNLYGHLLAGPFGKGDFVIGNGFSCTVKKGLLLSVYVDDMKLAGKKQNFDPMWNVLKKKSIWENQHRSLIMYTWVALNENVK